MANWTQLSGDKSGKDWTIYTQKQTQNNQKNASVGLRTGIPVRSLINSVEGDHITDHIMRSSMTVALISGTVPHCLEWLDDRHTRGRWRAISHCMSSLPSCSAERTSVAEQHRARDQSSRVFNGMRLVHVARFAVGATQHAALGPLDPFGPNTRMLENTKTRLNVDELQRATHMQWIRFVAAHWFCELSTRSTCSLFWHDSLQ